MTLYKLIKEISDILFPKTDDLYNYMLYTSDDNGGFLRTRYCWWDKPVKDRELGDGYEKVMLTSTKPIDFDKLKDKTNTYVRLQFTYELSKATFDDSEWDVDLGYEYVYLIDLKNKTYEMKCIEDIYH